MFAITCFIYAFLWFSVQCGKSASTQPTQITCSHAQRMVHCCTGRRPHLQTCPPSYKAKTTILSTFNLCENIITLTVKAGGRREVKDNFSGPFFKEDIHSMQRFLKFARTIQIQNTTDNNPDDLSTIETFFSLFLRWQEQQHDISQCNGPGWREPVAHQRLAQWRLQ